MVWDLGSRAQGVRERAAKEQVSVAVKHGA